MRRGMFIARNDQLNGLATLSASWSTLPRNRGSEGAFDDRPSDSGRGAVAAAPGNRIIQSTSVGSLGLCHLGLLRCHDEVLRNLISRIRRLVSSHALVLAASEIRAGR